MKKLLYYPFLILFGLGIFSACDNLDDVEPEINNLFLDNSELVTTYTSSYINKFINMAMFEYPELAALKNKMNLDVEVYKITYNTKFNNKNVKASGIVCLPKQEGEYPILNYNNGTNTLHSNAPSENPSDNLFQLLEMTSSNGFIVAIPDYIGFGSSEDMFHPYLHKESTIKSITDMFYAIKEFVRDNDNVSFNDEIYISGYSQGGWTAIQMQKAIENDDKLEFKIKASACGAGPYNLTTVTDHIVNQEEYSQPYFLGYLLNSFTNLGMTTNITDILQEPYASRLASLYNGSNSGGEINEQLTTNTTQLFTPEFISSWKTDDKYASFREMLAANSVTAYNTSIPTKLMHGTEDTYVPQQVTNEIYNTFMELGVSSTLVKNVELTDHNHKTGIIPSGLTSVLWFIEMKDSD